MHCTLRQLPVSRSASLRSIVVLYIRSTSTSPAIWIYRPKSGTATLTEREAYPLKTARLPDLELWTDAHSFKSVGQGRSIRSGSWKEISWSILDTPGYPNSPNFWIPVTQLQLSGVSMHFKVESLSVSTNQVSVVNPKPLPTQKHCQRLPARKTT